VVVGGRWSLVAAVVEVGWWWATVVGDGERRRAVVVVVGERAGDVTISHDEPDLAGSGPRPARCPQEAINCFPLSSAMAQWLLACDYILEVLGSSLACCIFFFTIYIYNIRVLDYI
jgi:hypothetical protein